MTDEEIEKLLAESFGVPQWNYATPEMRQFAIEGFRACKDISAKTMRTFGVFGLKHWGRSRPAIAIDWTPDGRCFMPLFLGVWIRCPRLDHEVC